MKNAEFTKRLAKSSKLSRAAAADQLDRVVFEILQCVRKGQFAHLPGLGTFGPSQDDVFNFEQIGPRIRGAK